MNSKKIARMMTFMIPSMVLKSLNAQMIRLNFTKDDFKGLFPNLKEIKFLRKFEQWREDPKDLFAIVFDEGDPHGFKYSYIKFNQEGNKIEYYDPENRVTSSTGIIGTMDRVAQVALVNNRYSQRYYYLAGYLNNRIDLYNTTLSRSSSSYTQSLSSDNGPVFMIDFSGINAGDTYLVIVADGKVSRILINQNGVTGKFEYQDETVAMENIEKFSFVILNHHTFLVNFKGETKEMFFFRYHNENWIKKVVDKNDGSNVECDMIGSLEKFDPRNKQFYCANHGEKLRLYYLDYEVNEQSPSLEITPDAISLVEYRFFTYVGTDTTTIAGIDHLSREGFFFINDKTLELLAFMDYDINSISEIVYVDKLNYVFDYKKSSVLVLDFMFWTGIEGCILDTRPTTFLSGSCHDCSPGYELVELNSGLKGCDKICKEQGERYGLGECINCREHDSCLSCNYTGLACYGCLEGYEPSLPYQERGKLCRKTCPNGTLLVQDELGDSCVEQDKGHEEVEGVEESGDDQSDPLLLESITFLRSKLKIYFKFAHGIDQKNIQEVFESVFIKSTEFEDDRILVENPKIYLKENSPYTLVLEIPSFIEKIPDQGLTNSTLILRIKHGSQITSTVSDKFTMKYPKTELSYHPFVFKNLKGFLYNSNFQKSAQITIASISSASYISLLISPSVGLEMIKLPQFLELLNFFNIEYPQNLARFLRIFDQGILDFLNMGIINFSSSILGGFGRKISFESMAKVEQEIGCRPHPKLEENNLGCLLIPNAGGVILTIAILVIVKLILVAIKMCFKERKGKMSTISSKINKKVGVDFFVVHLNAIQLELMVSVMINLSNMIFRRVLGVLSSVLAIAFLVVYIAVISLVNYITLFWEPVVEEGDGDREIVDKEPPFEFFRDKLKDNFKKSMRPNIPRQMLAIEMTSDMLQPVFLILFLDNPGLQIFPFMAIYLALVVISAVYRPYKSRIEVCRNVMLKFISFLILLFLALLWILGESLSEITKERLIGKPIIAFIFIMLGLSSLTSVYEMFVGVKTWVRERKKTSKVHALEDIQAKIEDEHEPEYLPKEERMAVTEQDPNPTRLNPCQVDGEAQDRSFHALINIDASNEGINREEEIRNEQFTPLGGSLEGQRTKLRREYSSNSQVWNITVFGKDKKVSPIPNNPVTRKISGRR